MKDGVGGMCGFTGKAGPETYFTNPYLLSLNVLWDKSVKNRQFSCSKQI